MNRIPEVRGCNSVGASHRNVLAALLVLLPLSMGATRISTEVSLNRKGQGDVLITIETNLEELRRLAAATEPQLLDSFLVRQLLAPPLELQKLLERQGFGGVTVRQAAKQGLQTEVTAHISDMRALTGYGGELSLTEAPGSFLDLSGSAGGALAGNRLDLSALRDVVVTLRIEFPGAVRKTDGSAKISHSGRGVIYQWTGEKLLVGPTQVAVRVVPDIEETPYFWLSLILGVTAIVILGTYLVLRRGREAIKTGPV